MDKLKKVGLTALAGTFAATSAQALEMSVSGSAGLTMATADSDETTGNRFSFGDSLTFSGSGDYNDWTITASIEADGASSTTYYDDRSITIDMNDGGKIHIQESGAQGTPADLVSTAYGSASYSLVGSTTAGIHYADGLASGANSGTNLGYSTSVSGFDIAIGHSAGVTGGSDTSFNIKYADLIDGLTLSIGRSDLNSAQVNGTEEQTISAKYVMGSVTLAYADASMDDDNASGTDYDGRHMGVSFAVNDDLTISYDVSKSDKSSASVDEESSSLQASYTMGSMTIKGHVSKTDDSGFSSGAEDNGKAVAVSWSF